MNPAYTVISLRLVPLLFFSPDTSGAARLPDRVLSRSIIFTNGTVEARLAAASKEREHAKSRSSVITTKIQPLVSFYPAEVEHQKFELKHRPLLLQLMGNLSEEELIASALATKLNAYAADLCAPHIQMRIDSKISDILRNGWPILQEI